MGLLQPVRKLPNGIGPELIPEVSIDTHAEIDADGFIFPDAAESRSLRHGGGVSRTSMGAVKKGGNRTVFP